MLREISPQQLGEWLAYYQTDPWGEYRADLRMGIVIANVLQALGAKKQGGGSFTAADFMPDFDRENKATALATKARAVLFALPGRKAATPKA